MTQNAISTGQRLNGLQAARGLAAFLVVLTHTQHMLYAYHERHGIPLPWFSHPLWMTLGNAGVDIFFVISGFIIVHVSWDQFHKTGAGINFLARRLIRLVPLYWACTALMMVAFLFFPTVIQSGRTTSLGHIIASFLFLPWATENGDNGPLLIMGWSLNYEMFFYVLIGGLMFLSRNRALSYVSVILFSLLGVASIATHFGITKYGIWFFANTVILEFIAGMGLAILYRYARLPKSWLLPSMLGALGLIASSVWIGLPTSSWRGIVWGIPATLIVLGALNASGRLRIPNFLLRFGDASYSLYLTHFFIQVAIGRFWVKFLPNTEISFLPLAAIIIPCFAACAFYECIELPVQKKLLKMYSDWRTHKVKISTPVINITQ